MAAINKLVPYWSFNASNLETFFLQDLERQKRILGKVLHFLEKSKHMLVAI